MSSATTGMGSPALELLEQETVARVKWRLIPLLFLCYYAAYLDRVNVGFAALHMNKALGLTAATFGWVAAYSSSAIFCRDTVQPDPRAGRCQSMDRPDPVDLGRDLRTD